MAEIYEGYAQELIDFVIDNITDGKSDEAYRRDNQIEDSDGSDFDFEKVKRTRKRRRDVQFDIDDIMGMFDIDDFGNIILNRETMRDNLNRRVNLHGYLVDQKRNIINQDGDIIFEAEELDEDEEIPMPYRFEKRKKQVLKHDEKVNEVQTEKNFDIDSILQEEENKVEEEFQRLKDASRPSSVDSLMGNAPVNEENGQDNQY